MSVTYHQVLRQIALRVGALRGTQVEGVETSYITAPLTKAEISADSPVNFSALKDAVLMAEGKLATAIAETGNHPFRRVLLSQTANIASGALIPSTNAASVPVIGIRGSVVDATDGIVCERFSRAEVRRLIRNANSWRKGAIYAYDIDDSRIFHTRTNVKIDVCTYDAATQRTAIDANSAMLLPDVLEEALVSGGAAYLGKDNGFFAMTLGAIRQGLISVEGKAAA